MCGLFTVAGAIDHLEMRRLGTCIEYRGPDDTDVLMMEDGGAILFHRLAIMDLSHKGDQPFVSVDHQVTLVCNGEIYNYKKIKEEYKDRFEFKSQSDCEVLIPLYESIGIEQLCKKVDAEFALVLYDNRKKRWIAARDPIGIRPLFYGYGLDGKICFASEAKALTLLCKEIKPFPPGHYYDGEQFKSYLKIWETPVNASMSRDEALAGIKKYLTEGVRKRLQSDAPVGFLLSGGLDSSLVCAIAAREGKKLTTFAVGMNENPIDTKYAKIVADFLGTDHHEVLFTKADIFESLENLIYRLETFDITTVRASIGMDFVCRYVRANTNIKVLLTGEVSDELFGYKYTDFAPSADAFQEESRKRVRELYLYDVLRADRCLSSNSIEARVPFSDDQFVKHVLSIPPEFKMNKNKIGKFILRQAFEGQNYLPDSILWREKAAFSDAVGHSMVDYLKAYAEEQYSEDDFINGQKKYQHCPPTSKEALLYRDIFEQFFAGQSKLIPEFWLPNRSWENCDVTDPSARVLPNYGKSGQ